jgi:hypothetical protein
MHTVIDAQALAAGEQELIRAAVGNQGAIEVVTRAETHGRVAVAGKIRFFDPYDPSVAEKYIALLAHLKELDLLHAAPGRKAYELTNFGWQLSRNLGR